MIYHCTDILNEGDQMEESLYLVTYREFKSPMTH